MKSDKRYLYYYIGELDEFIEDIDISIQSDGKHLSEEALTFLKNLKKDLEIYKNQFNGIIDGTFIPKECKKDEN